MHTHMHRIQLNAYLICTLYIGYAHTCICMYLTVSACILAHWSCIKCICACMSYTYMPAYMQIHTHMHCSKAMHMCMYFCHEYMHMCIFESSAYLYVSDCISRSHTFTYASILWFLLRQIGRPQQRATRESVIIIGINDCHNWENNHLRFVTVLEGSLYLTAERRVIFRGHDCLLPCAAGRASL